MIFYQYKITLIEYVTVLMFLSAFNLFKCRLTFMIRTNLKDFFFYWYRHLKKYV